MAKTDSRANLKHVKSGSLSRGASLVTTGVRMGMRLGSYSLGNLWRSREKRDERWHHMLSEQARLLAEELGKLKGSVMKVGQALALYGEQLLLPQEVIDALRTLQDDSPPLQWSALQKILEKELGAERLAQLDIDPEPLAAASMGQVHRAHRLRDGRELCIKIQYPGVAESIDSDLNAVTRLLLFSHLLPKGFDLNDMVEEIRSMLHREVDYALELETMKRFHQLLEGDTRFRVPEAFPEFSTRRVLTSSYEPGLVIETEAVQTLSQERRNRVSEAALELFLLEFFRWNLVQTDPNFGNYRVRLDPQGQQDQLVLLDFGAVRQFEPAFLHAYHELVRGAFWKDKDRLIKAVKDLHFMPAGVSQDALERFAEMCFVIVEPFDGPDQQGEGAQFINAKGEYRWGASDLPQRVALAASKASLTVYFRLPPREFVFLHRKLGGVFVFLAELNAELNARSLLMRYLKEPNSQY